MATSISLLAAAFAVAPAAASAAGINPLALVDVSSCAAPAVSQALLPYKDAAWYFAAPGGDFASPEASLAAGWQLSGGAAIVPTTRADGTTGYSLDLPSGSKAVSPNICITHDYPKARMWVRNVVGGEGVQFNVSYMGTNTWGTPKATGTLKGGPNGWQLAAPINLQPYGGYDSWQIVKFTFVPGGKTSDFQIDDVWVDPMMRW